MNFLDVRIHLECRIFCSENGQNGMRCVHNENEGCCLPRISLKYGPLLDLLCGSERGPWAHRSNSVYILRDDGPCAGSALYHCALLAELHPPGDQTSNLPVYPPLPATFPISLA